MTKEDQIIMYDSPEAAHEGTVKGWVSNTGRFWGKDEHIARWDGCTHKKCSCGEAIAKNRMICSECRTKAENIKYANMPVQEYNGEVVYSEGCQEYFYDEDEILDYCEQNGEPPESLMLIICNPNYLPEIEPDIWQDFVPEDGELDEIISSEVQDALDNLNKVIKESKRVTLWTPGKYRTELRG